MCKMIKIGDLYSNLELSLYGLELKLNLRRNYDDGALHRVKAGADRVAEGGNREIRDKYR